MPLSFKEGLLSFSCSSKYKVGKSAKIKLTLIYGESIHTPTVSITVVAFEPAAEGTFLCTGALDISKSKLPGLVMQMAYAGVEGADRRGSKRLPYTIRILSKELSSFRAVTTNINVTGTELNCDSPVAPGHFMNLQFDLESVGFPELKMQAVCVWTIDEVDESRRTRYRVGVSFTEQHPETHAAWAKFYRSVLATEGASVMLKSMDGGSVPDKNAELANLAAAAAPAPPSPPPPPPPPPLPTASSSGQWTTPPTGNPFATQEMPALPSSDQPGGYGFPSPQQSSQLNLVTPPAEVPSATQMGGGFNTQAAPPPPLLPNKLSLPPAGSPQPPQEQHPGGFGGPSQPAGGFGFPSPSQPAGFSGPSQPAGGFGFPPSSQPSQQAGFGFPSSQPSGGFTIPPAQPPQQGGGGFGFPSSQPAQGGGFQLPPSPPPQGGGGFGFPSASSSGGFQIPPLPPPNPPGGFAAPSTPQPGGFSFPPSSQPSPGGFQIPPPLAPQGQQGFGFPSPPPQQQQGFGTSGPPQPGGFGFPSSPPAGGGFQIPPPSPPPQQGGFGFPASQPPAAQQGGFSFPSSPPASQQGGFGFPSPPAQPERVEPMGINGPNLAYRGRYDDSCRPGARKQVQLSFNVGGKVTSVAIHVSLTRVEPSPDGNCVCWCTVLEDEQKIQVLNQVLGS